MAVVRGMAFLPIVGAGAAPAPSAIPDFSSNGVSWSGYVARLPPTEAHARTFNDFTSPASGPGPVTDDPAPSLRQQRGVASHRQAADIPRGECRQSESEALGRRGAEKANARALSGAAAYTREARCWDTGVPAFHLNPGEMYIVQTPKQVWLFLAGRVRRIYLNVPHSANPKPSWYGESVGTYENGDTLVVDTIGFNDKTFVDSYRTPHTTQLHVVERFKLINGGDTLEVSPSGSRTRARSTRRGRERATASACSAVRSSREHLRRGHRELSSITISSRSRPRNAPTSDRKEKGPEHRSGPFMSDVEIRQFGYALRFTI